MKGISKLILTLAVPLIILYEAFVINILLGLIVLLAYIVYGCYKIRDEFFAFLGNKKYMEGKDEECYKWLKKAYETKKCTPKVQNAYGFILLKLGYIEEAEKVLENLANKKITKDEAMRVKANQALAVWKKGNVFRAIPMLEEIYSNFKNTNIYAYLGYLLIIKGDLEKALKVNIEAYDYNNTSSDIVGNISLNYYLIDELDKGKEICEKFIAQKPNYAQVNYIYALILEKQNNFAEALINMKKVIGSRKSILSDLTEEKLQDKIKELENRKSE